MVMLYTNDSKYYIIKIKMFMICMKLIEVENII